MIRGHGTSSACEDPRITVLKDFQEERPLSSLSCYSHKREGVNDLTGDASFEECRWKHYNVTFVPVCLSGEQNDLCKPDVSLL
jgi:hypothetical protein